MTSTLVRVGESNWPRLAEVFGELKEVILPAQLHADTVLIRLPIPMDNRWQYQSCERRKDLNLVPAKLSFEEVAIATYTMSQQRLLEGLRSGAKVTTIPRLERRGRFGKRGSFAGV